MLEVDNAREVDIGTKKTLELDRLSSQLEVQCSMLYVQGNTDASDRIITDRAKKWLIQDRDFLKESLAKRGNYSAFQLLNSALLISTVARYNIREKSDSKKSEGYRQIESLAIDASGFIVENLDQITERVEEGDFKGKAGALETVASAIKYLDAYQGNRCADLLVKNFLPTLRGSQDIKGDFSRIVALAQLTQVLAQVFRYGSDSQRYLMRVLIMSVFQKEDPKAIEFVQDSIVDLSLDESISEMEAEVVPDILTQYKFPRGSAKRIQPIIFDWARAGSLSKNGDENEGISRNLKSVFSLESQRPGIASELHREFGISLFSRYPEKMMVAQYDERNRSDDGVPYAVIINSKSDREGAFYHNKETMRNLFEKLRGQYRLRVFEVASVQELVGFINKARKRYGQISFGIFGAHGTKDDMQLGEILGIPSKSVGSSDRLNKKHLNKKGSASLPLAFVDNPTIILNSCSTGEIGGIGQAVSRLKGTVIAPPVPASMADINIKVEGSGVNFTVKYMHHDRDSGDQDVPAQVYKDGKLI